MRKGFLVIPLCVLVIFHVWVTSQSSYFSFPEVNIELEAFSLEKEKDNLKLQRIENITIFTFQFDEEILNLSIYREPEHFEWSIFDVSIDTNIPLRKNLKLSFCLYASQLNSSTDSVYVSLTLTDGTNEILIGYYLGYQLSDTRFERSYQVFYGVGNMSDTWIKGKRNIWDDLVQKNLPVTRSLNIVKATFGILSHRPTPQISNNGKIQTLFNASENLLFFENSVFVKTTPNLYQPPWNAIFLLVIDVFFVFFVTIFKIPKG